MFNWFKKKKPKKPSSIDLIKLRFEIDQAKHNTDNYFKNRRKLRAYGEQYVEEYIKAFYPKNRRDLYGIFIAPISPMLYACTDLDGNEIDWTEEARKTEQEAVEFVKKVYGEPNFKKYDRTN
jgi:hypothetical protein